MMKERILNKSLDQGYSESRLPAFTQDEIEMIKGLCVYEIERSKICVFTNFSQRFNIARIPCGVEIILVSFTSGTWDFFGLNHYTTDYVKHQDMGIDPVSYETDRDLYTYMDPDWPVQVKQDSLTLTADDFPCFMFCRFAFDTDCSACCYSCFTRLVSSQVGLTLVEGCALGNEEAARTHKG